MKLLVLSDSHGDLRSMKQAVRAEQPDYVLHLGDCSRDAEHLRQAFPMLAIAGVRGNCDYADYITPEEKLIEYAGVRLLLCHGHRYGVKSSLLRLNMSAQEKEADVALFGHTHRAFCEEKNGIWLLNPGSCGYDRPSCGIIEIRNGKAVCSVKPISEKEELE